jgi:hypothetical protein
LDLSRLGTKLFTKDDALRISARVAKLPVLTSKDLVTLCQTTRRQAYSIFKTIAATLAGPHVSNAMSADMFGPFRRYNIRGTLRTLTN